MASELPDEVVKGNQQFAWDLYRKLREQEGNLFYSPFSISTALAMTSMGAKGKTLQEMLTVLHLPEGDTTHAGLGSLLAGLAASDMKKDGYEVTTANALWGQKGHLWRKEFLDSTKKHYGAGLSEVDFISATEEARKTINAWVEKQTKDKIRDLLPQGVLTNLTRLVLTNAIYFKGNWAKPFPPHWAKPSQTKQVTDQQFTSRGDWAALAARGDWTALAVELFQLKQVTDLEFTLQNGKKEMVPMMRQSERFRFFANEELKVLEMLYVGDDLSMVLFLPNKKDGLPELEKQLTPENVNKWIGKLELERVEVALPKFKVESRFGLNDVLRSLGMKLPFDDQEADFSGMNDQTELSIAAVVHKAFVEVNEEGTEAAAATSVEMTSLGGPPNPTFIADHPFVFVIHDRKTKTVLFVGRVVNPK
jgi:serine protease inhibitor